MCIIIGGVCEWYDFVVFSSFAQNIGLAFFPPSTNPLASTIDALFLFVIGYLARPVGAILFSSISDTRGRAVCLKLTPVTITISSTAIAFIPNYTHIGLVAPLLLLMLRFVQGMSIGGEYCNSAVYIYEKAPENRRGFLLSLLGIAPATGIVLASGIAALLAPWIVKEPEMWRVCFLLSALLGVVSFFFRLKLTETRSFIAAKNRQAGVSVPFLQTLRQGGGRYLILIALHAFYSISFYFQIAYLPSYLERHFAFTKSESLWLVSTSSILNMIFLPVNGFLCDKFGPKRVLATTCLLALVLCPILFFTIQHPISYYLFSLVSLFNCVAVPLLCLKTLPVLMRGTVFAVSYNMGMGFLGGTVPLICTFLEVQGRALPIFYVVAAAGVSLVMLFAFFKKKDALGRIL